jgi:prepilin peptidase dependent protein D
MKIPTVRRQGGFTLVELLVVIAIIAVLAAAGFSAGNAAIQKAKKVTTLATAVGIEGAVNAFFSEYGSLPTDATDDTVVVDTSLDVNLITALTGLTETKVPPYNTKAIKFLSVKEGKKIGSSKGINGMIYSEDGKSVVGLYDAWGGGFKVQMDGDYDERLTGVKPKGSSSPVNLNGRRCVVWSDGADGVTGIGNTNDDVKTW